MDIASAFQYLNASDANSNAAKFPVWSGGYVYKTTTGLTEQETAANKHRLVFVHSNGDQYVFKWNGVADYSYEGYLAHTGTDTLAALTGTPVAGTSLTFDADFLEAICGTTWETGAQATYESRRTGGGVW